LPEAALTRVSNEVVTSAALTYVKPTFIGCGFDASIDGKKGDAFLMLPLNAPLDSYNTSAETTFTTEKIRTKQIKVAVYLLTTNFGIGIDNHTTWVRSNADHADSLREKDKEGADDFIVDVFGAGAVLSREEIILRTRPIGGALVGDRLIFLKGSISTFASDMEKIVSVLSMVKPEKKPPRFSGAYEYLEKNAGGPPSKHQYTGAYNSVFQDALAEGKLSSELASLITAFAFVIVGREDEADAADLAKLENLKLRTKYPQDVATLKRTRDVAEAATDIEGAADGAGSFITMFSPDDMKGKTIVAYIQNFTLHQLKTHVHFFYMQLPPTGKKSERIMKPAAIMKAPKQSIGSGVPRPLRAGAFALATQADAVEMHFRRFGEYITASKAGRAIFRKYFIEELEVPSAAVPNSADGLTRLLFEGFTPDDEEAEKILLLRKSLGLREEGEGE